MPNDREIRKAIKSASLEKVIAILPSDIHEFLTTKMQDSILHHATRHDRVDVLKFIRDNYCGSSNIWEAANVHGKRPLHEAAQCSSIECAKFLIDQKVQIDSLKHADWTPLMLACTQDNVSMTQILIKAGANVNLKNKDGWTSFHIACRRGNVDVVSCLVECSQAVDFLTTSHNGRTPLHTVALHGRLSLAEWLTDKKLCHPPDTADTCGSTPLMDAIRSGHVTLARLLILRCKANITKEDNLGRQCLHIAAQAGWINAVEFICGDMGVDVDAQCKDGTTSLHLAIWEGHVAMVKLLLKRGASVMREDAKGRTAADIARLKKQQDIAYLLKVI